MPSHISVRTLCSSRNIWFLSLVSLVIVLVAINRSYVFARDHGLLDSAQNRDGHDELQLNGQGGGAFDARDGLRSLNPSRTAADSDLDRQDVMVAQALQHVNEFADADKSLQWSSNPEEQAARAAALAEMMGLTTPTDASSSIPRDLSAARARRSTDMVEAVRGCTTLECLQVAHERPPGPARFNFPHFMIIGWQKTATTSLHAHLLRHPQVARPWDKEPEFFSYTCDFKAPSGCPPDKTEDYVRRVLRANRYTAYDGQMACYEASTHYSRSGVEVAPTVAAVFPWVRVVALLRDPISRAASMLVHMYDKNITSSVGPGGCLAQRKMDMGGCLLEFSQISNDDWGGPTNYSTPLKAWLDAFPSDQVFLGQFEALTAEETERQELVRVKKFLGLNPNLPKAPYDTLGLSNSRKGRINPDGWPMQRNVYEDLVKLVRPDCEAVAALVDKHGLGDGSQWMANWEAVWQRNLDTCDDSGSCLVQLS